MAFKYPYTFRLGDDGVLLRIPIVRVVFTNPKNKKQVEVGFLIDSGADDIFLNTRLAEALGVDITKGATKEYQGITSTPVVATVLQGLSLLPVRALLSHISSDPTHLHPLDHPRRRVGADSPTYR
jgi:hypothetical protein